MAVILLSVLPAFAKTIPSDQAIDAKVVTVISRTGAKGMAVSVIDHGQAR